MKTAQETDKMLVQEKVPASLIIPGKKQEVITYLTNGIEPEPLTEQEKNEICRVINSNDYPQQIRPLVETLANYTTIENLKLCSQNLPTLTIIEKKLFKFAFFKMFIVSGGCYDIKDNILTYKTDESIPHEFLHMASTPLDKNLNPYKSYTGFYSFSNREFSALGLNEGYTEMLANRIFKNENYHTSSYRTNVYLMRLFEQLYDTKEDMENAYFNADCTSPIKQFLKYGTLEEYLDLLQDLDYYAECRIENDEELESFYQLKKIIEKTEDNDRITAADEITKEYYEYKKSR